MRSAFAQLLAPGGLALSLSLLGVGCGDADGSALEPLVLEGPEAYQTIQEVQDARGRAPFTDIRIGSTSIPLTLVYIVDGKVVDPARLRLELKAEDVASINIYKPDQARPKFGLGGDTAVIEIIGKGQSSPSQGG